MERRKQVVAALIEVHFYDLSRRPELFDGVHQLLMTGENEMTMSHGAQVTSIPYGEIQEIRVKFRYE